MKFSVKTAMAVFLLLAVFVAAFFLIKDKISDSNKSTSDIQFLSTTLDTELPPSGSTLIASGFYGFVKYNKQLKDMPDSKMIIINLYTDRDQLDTLQKSEKIIKRFFPDNTDEIMKAVEKSIECAKSRKYINGYPYYKLDKPENNSSVKIVNWRKETGGVNICIYLYILKDKGDV